MANGIARTLLPESVQSDLAQAEKGREIDIKIKEPPQREQNILNALLKTSQVGQSVLRPLFNFTPLGQAARQAELLEKGGEKARKAIGLDPAKGTFSDPQNKAQIDVFKAALSGDPEALQAAVARRDTLKQSAVEKDKTPPSAFFVDQVDPGQLDSRDQFLQVARPDFTSPIVTGAKLQIQGAEQEAIAKEKGLTARAEARGRRQADFDLQAEDLRTSIKDFKQFSQDQEKRLTGFIEDFARTPPRKTVSQFFAEKSTPQRLMFGLALMANQNNPNMLKFLDSVIASDLDLQKAEFEKAGVLVDKQNSFLSNATSRFSTRIGAEKATTAAMQQAAVNEIDAITDRMGAGLQKSNLSSAKGRILAAMGQNLIEARKAEEEFFGRDLLKEKLRSGMRITPGDLTPEERKTFVPLLNEFAGDAIDKKGLEKNFSAVKKSLNIIDDLIDFREKHGAEKVPSSDLRIARQNLVKLQLQMKGPQAFDLGVLAGVDFELIQKATLEDPGEFGFVMDALQNIRSGLMSDVLVDIQAKGFRPTRQLTNFLSQPTGALQLGDQGSRAEVKGQLK